MKVNLIKLIARFNKINSLLHIVSHSCFFDCYFGVSFGISDVGMLEFVL